MKTIVKQWEACQKIKLFEVPVIDKRTNEATFIIFDIELKPEENAFVAQHEALSKAQADSKYIVCVKTMIDTSFSLNENLQALHDECMSEIEQSEYFMLPTEEE